MIQENSHESNHTACTRLSRLFNRHPISICPELLGLSQIPAILAYALAVTHLIVTLATDFPFGVFKLIPFTIHGWIERLVGPSLIALPFIAGFANEEIARNFYIALGLVIIVVGSLTNYQGIARNNKI